jgi:hypothetical protein
MQLEGLSESLVGRFFSSQDQLDFYGGVFYSVFQRLAYLPSYEILG